MMLNAASLQIPCYRLGSLRISARVILLVGYAILVILRMPEVFIKGRFWAEEGAVYFRNAWNEPWYQALLAIHTGYLNLSATFATLLSAHLVDIAYAPWVSSGYALLIQLCPAILLMSSRIEWLENPFTLIPAFLLVALQPNSSEVWLNSITSQFHLALCAALILAMEPRRGLAGALQIFLLVIGVLSGPVSAFLAPLFFLRAFIDRSRPRTVQALTAGVLAALQVALVLLHPEPGRIIGIGPRLFILAAYEKNLLVPFIGTSAADQVTRDIAVSLGAGKIPILPIGAYLAAAVTVSAAVWRVHNKEVTWLFVSGVVILLLSYFSALGNHMQLVEAVGLHRRYAYVPNVLFGLSLLGIAAIGPFYFRRIAGALAVWLILVGVHEYRCPASDTSADGPGWRSELARWRADPGYAVQLWPADPSWKFWLGPRPPVH